VTARDLWRWTDERGVQRLVGTDELRAALSTGLLLPSTLVWRDGMKEWAPASSMPELASAAFAAAGAAPGAVPFPEEDSFDGRSTLKDEKDKRRTTLLGVPPPGDEVPEGAHPLDVPAAGQRPERPGVTQIPPYGAPSPDKPQVPKVPPAGVVGFRLRPPAAIEAEVAKLTKQEMAADIPPPKRKITTSEIDGLWAGPPSEEDETLPRRSRPSELAAAAAASAEAAARPGAKAPNADAAASLDDGKGKAAAPAPGRPKAPPPKPPPVPRRPAVPAAAAARLDTSAAAPAPKAPPPLPPAAAGPAIRAEEPGPAPAAARPQPRPPMRAATAIGLSPSPKGPPPLPPRKAAAPPNGAAASPEPAAGARAKPPPLPAAKPSPEPAPAAPDLAAPRPEDERPLVPIHLTTLEGVAAAKPAGEAVAIAVKPPDPTPAVPPDLPGSAKRQITATLVSPGAPPPHAAPPAAPPAPAPLHDGEDEATAPGAPKRADSPPAREEARANAPAPEPIAATPAAIGPPPLPPAEPYGPPPLPPEVSVPVSAALSEPFGVLPLPATHPPEETAPLPPPRAPVPSQSSGHAPYPPLPAALPPTETGPAPITARLPEPSRPPAREPLHSQDPMALLERAERAPRISRPSLSGHTPPPPEIASAPTPEPPSADPPRPMRGPVTVRPPPRPGISGGRVDPKVVLANPVPVPVSSLLAAGGVLIGMVVAAFFVGRASSEPTARLTAVPAFDAIPALARAALPPPPKPCWMVKQPVMWAPKVSKSIPFEVAPSSEGTIAVGYAVNGTEAVGIDVNLTTGEIRSLDDDKADDDIERVSLSPAGHIQVTRAGGGSRVKTPVPVPGATPFFVGLGEDAVVATPALDATPTPLWRVEGDEGLGAASVHAAGSRGFLLTFRRGGAIWSGWVRGDRTAVGDLVKAQGSGGAVGKPSGGWNGREVALIFADRPDEDGHYEMRIGHASPGALPASTTVLPMPKGGPGGDAFAPDIAGLPDGRWLLVWTEGAAGSRAVRAQTLAADFTPLGDPIALSPPAGNFGQGVIGIAGDHAATVFLQKGATSYELWGAVLQCG
jgi:hypothetical protein